MKFKNVAKGPRMILLVDGGSVIIMPGETKSVDGAKILNGVPSGLIEDITKIATSEQRQALAHDDDESDLDPAPPALAEKATASAADLPILDGMNRQQLEVQAAAEGINLGQIRGTGAGGNLLVGDIKNAILIKRGAA